MSYSFCGHFFLEDGKEISVGFVDTLKSFNTIRYGCELEGIEEVSRPEFAKDLSGIKKFYKLKSFIDAKVQVKKDIRKYKKKVNSTKKIIKLLDSEMLSEYAMEDFEENKYQLKQAKYKLKSLNTIISLFYYFEGLVLSEEDYYRNAETIYLGIEV